MVSESQLVSQSFNYKITNSKNMKIIAFGEVLFDIIEGEPHLGGAPLNFAAHLAKCGWESYMLSRIGDDDLGKQAISQIEALGVKTTFIQKDDLHPTGTVPVTLRYGQPEYIISENVAYDFIAFNESYASSDTMDFDVLYFGTLAQRNSVSADTLKQLVTKKTFQHIFYDINLRRNSYTREVINNSLQLCTILKLNDDEVEVLTGMYYQKKLDQEAFLKQLTRDFKIEIVIVTAGDKGCYIFHLGTLSFVKGYSVQVKDTIGAGDAFSAAFIYYYLKCHDVLKAADIANKLGSYVAGSRGAIPEYTSEVNEMLGLE